MELYIKNRVVLYDEQDHETISQYKWHINDSGYAVWRSNINGKKTTIRMHRLIMNPPSDKVIDHINHNTLDNRRSNLRICTQSENMRNLSNQGKGYWYQKQNKNWVVEIHGKHIGCFSTEQEAVKIAELIRAGGSYKKPERTHCKHGHSLKDAYIYGKNKLCRICQSERSRKYYDSIKKRNTRG